MNMDGRNKKQLARKEVLIKTAKIMNYNGFQDLRSLYINILPYSIKVETPIQLFHYLDCVGQLSIKELNHNLKSMGYRESLKDLEQYVEMYESKDGDTKKHPGEIVKILKNGLRMSDISELEFIFDRNYCNQIDDVLIDICSYGLGMYLQPKHIYGIISSYVKQDTMESLKMDTMKGFAQYQHKCRDIEERIFILNLSRDLDNDESLQSLMFMYKLPISIWEKITNGFDLFKYLYSKGSIDLKRLSEYGTFTKFPTLANKVESFLKNLSIKYSKSCDCELIYKFGETLKRVKCALQGESNSIIFSDFMAHLLGNLNSSAVDLTKLALLLVNLERFDMVRSLTKMGLGKMSKQVPEGAAFSNEEFRLFQLKFRIDSITIGKLAELYNIQSPFFFPGEFLTYLCVHGLSDVKVLKENLKKIGKSELVPLLDCYE